ncbi:E3 ubiquitin-protein ligase RMA3-like [Senna tora]|uniref:E3 ubiquitin-protein ligase RMA n=1 Tax=Senna tora TaxID=362788 RepID=A0A835CBC5_9FABA|nr:E3 ubiquitin-protein ligase RMA3-like [Senna tora]
METACLNCNGVVSRKKILKSVSAQTAISDSDNGCFECNICLESAHDPVVTLCGHLYCWPCIFRWLQVQNSSDESDQRPTCPICKADISHTSLVPLYGRGTSSSDYEAKKPKIDLGIPRRPPPLSLNESQPFHYQQYFPHLYRGYPANGSPYLGGAAMPSFSDPIIGMFGDMVFTRIFGSSDANLLAYPYVNYYPHNGNGSLRMRRLEMQIDKSLSRVFVFLLCCIILCLLLF